MNILIIDDEPGICKSLKGMLSDEGHVVSTCLDGNTGRKYLSANTTDVLFLDVMLPDVDGIDLLKEMRPVFPKLHIIMMSGHADMTAAVRATRLGAHTFFEKPLNPDRVLIELAHLSHQAEMKNKLISLEARLLSETLIGHSPLMEKLKHIIMKTAPTDGRVLILGENGTGKELVARAIHEQSLRSKGPFVTLNCAALPEPLVESELFGYEKGAFTGAYQSKSGLFEMATGGTLFLDEVGDMGLSTQAKLLRVLEVNEAMRLGGNKAYRFDVRIVSATNQDLEASIEQGRFREDLFYRLNVMPVTVPSLRQRRQDIPVLANYFLDGFYQKAGKALPLWDEKATEIIQSYDWPGNVRELKNMMERLFIMHESSVITSEFIADLLGVEGVREYGEEKGNKLNFSLRERVNAFEKALIEKEFKATSGNVSEMARRFKMDRANLHRKMKQYQIKRMW